jgi:hypothetical protein
MKHPEFLLIPVFMFADYFLTVLAAVQKERKYDLHFRSDHYELNPLWQKDIRRKRWFNPRHTLLAVLSSILIIGAVEFGDLPEVALEGFLGFFFVLYGLILGRHVSNLLIFRYMAKKPEEISGQVTMAHALMLRISVHQYITFLPPLVLLGVFYPRPFVLGGLGGMVALLLIHTKWIILHKKQMKARVKSSTAPAGLRADTGPVLPPDAPHNS